MLKVLLLPACSIFFYIDSYALLKPEFAASGSEKDRPQEAVSTHVTAKREYALPVHTTRKFLSPERESNCIRWNGMENTAEDTDDYREYEHHHPVISGTRSRHRRGYSSHPHRTSPERAARQNSGHITYRTKKGDTLYSISRKFDVAVHEIRQANNILRNNTLYTGQRLKIPKKEISDHNRTATTEDTHGIPRFRWPLTSILTIQRDNLDGVRPIGIIITGRPGANVQCSAPGTVKKIGRMRGYGKYVIVRHRSSYLSVYANLAHISVQEGQQVPQGRTIGRIDLSSHSLHFQINRGGKAKNPLTLLPERS
jgi:LysM repeat protein